MSKCEGQKLDRAAIDFFEHLLQLRKNNKLHTIVENRLIELLKSISDYYPLKEIQGLAGGRNDLMLFEFSGKKVLFEIFASSTQVSRDLLILHKTKADIKIAVIIDKDADPKVLDKYLKENPDEIFPFIFISELFENPPDNCYLKLKQLIYRDEEAIFQRILRTKLSGENFLNWFRRYGIEVLSEEDIKEGNFNYDKVFITTILSKCYNQGISKSNLKIIGQWLSNEKTLEFIFYRVDIGLNLFLYTDLNENIGVYSDVDLGDWIRAGHYFPKVFVLISMNAVIYELEDHYLEPGVRIINPQRKKSMSIGASQIMYKDSQSIAIFSIPKDVTSIVLLPPMQCNKKTEDYMDLISILSPPRNGESN